MKIIFCDIDHTISDARWRDNMIDAASEKGWDDYHKALSEDKPIRMMIDLCNTLHLHGWTIIHVTVREEKWRQATVDWFIRYHVEGDGLIMKAAGDYRPAPEYKFNAVIDYNVSNKADVIIIDDRDDVIAVFRDAGYRCIQAYMV